MVISGGEWCYLQNSFENSKNADLETLKQNHPSFNWMLHIVICHVIFIVHQQNIIIILITMMIAMIVMIVEGVRCERGGVRQESLH